MGTAVGSTLPSSRGWVRSGFCGICFAGLAGGSPRGVVLTRNRKKKVVELADVPELLCATMVELLAENVPCYASLPPDR